MKTLSSRCRREVAVALLATLLLGTFTPEHAIAIILPRASVLHGAPGGAPSRAAQADADSINDSLSGLGSDIAAAYVGYALNHEFAPCFASWPNGIVPTVPMSDKFYSGCWLLQDPTLTPVDLAYILSQIPDWPTIGSRPLR